MKYPIEQYEKLLKVLTHLKKVIDLQSVNPSALHYIAFQQLSAGQNHNWLYKKDGEVKRAHQIPDLSGWQKVVPERFDFELYPNDCTDANIETAVKKAVKQLTNQNQC